MIFQTLDLISSTIVIVCGFKWFLLSSLRLEIMPPIAVNILTLFGMLSPEPTFDRTFPLAVGGGIFALTVGVINSRALLNGLGNEKEGAKTARIDMNFVGWTAWLITAALARMDNREELAYMSGSFSNVWMVTFAIFFAVHALMVKNNWKSIRGPMQANLFKHKLNKVDMFNSIIFIMYGVMMFLAGSVRFGPARAVMPYMIDMFGMLEPRADYYPAFGFGLDTLGGGCFALAMAAINLTAFAGSAEDRDYAMTRRYANVVFYCGQIVTFAHMKETGSFYDFWTILALSQIVLILRAIHGAHAKKKQG